MITQLIVAALCVVGAACFWPLIPWLETRVGKRQTRRLTRDCSDRYHWDEIRNAATPGADDLGRLLIARSVIL